MWRRDCNTAVLWYIQNIMLCHRARKTTEPCRTANAADLSSQTESNELWTAMVSDYFGSRVTSTMPWCSNVRLTPQRIMLNICWRRGYSVWQRCTSFLANTTIIHKLIHLSNYTHSISLHFNYPKLTHTSIVIVINDSLLSLLLR